MPDTSPQGAPARTLAAEPSVRGLARCLTALELEARALHRPLAATLIGAAAAVLQDGDSAPPSATP